MLDTTIVATDDCGKVSPLDNTDELLVKTGVDGERPSMALLVFCTVLFTDSTTTFVFCAVSVELANVLLTPVEFNPTLLFVGSTVLEVML